MRRRDLLPAVIVGCAAFALYRSTLLPGVDFGDTGSFQATVGSPIITPRKGYPLYFAIPQALVWLPGTEPAPASAAFLLVTAPAGWRSLLTPRVVGLAVLCAAAGALLYLGNLRALWLMPEAPRSLAEGLQHFWFDVTKSDWRDTMVMNVPRNMLSDHLAMYWFDLRQQFGLVAAPLGVAGLAHLASSDWRRAVLLGVSFAVNLVFAFSYNVGDKHVFYLPSHVFIALLAGCGVTAA